MSEREFMICTPEYYTLRHQGVNKLQRENIELQRFFTSRIMSMWSKDGVKPEQVFRFPWEKRRQPLTVAEFFGQNAKLISKLEKEKPN